MLIAAGGVFALMSLIRGLKFKNDVLTGCGYSVGGGMTGGYRRADLKTDPETGEVKLVLAEKEYHSSREIKTVYPASAKDLEAVKEIVNRYNLYNSSKKGRSRIQVLDGDTTTVSFDYLKGDFSVSDSQALSRRDFKAIDEISSFLYSLAKGEGVTTVEPQEARIVADGYSFFFYIEPEFDGKLDGIVTEDFTVYGYKEVGTVVGRTDALDTGNSVPLERASGGDIVYDKGTGEIIIIYKDCELESGSYLLAKAESWYQQSAEPIIKAMEGVNRMYLN